MQELLSLESHDLLLLNGFGQQDWWAQRCGVQSWLRCNPEDLGSASYIELEGLKHICKQS